MIFEIMPHVREALHNLISSKLRSFLAILGILVGTGSVVAMVSSGQLATEAALEQFRALGTNLLAVSFYDQSSGDSKQATKTRDFTPADVAKMADISSDIKLAAPYTTLFLPVSYAGHPINNVVIIGATDILQPAIKINMIKGRFISFLDKFEYYCVIGNSLYQQLRQYTLEDPIGLQLRIGDNVFTIIGVAEHWVENQFFNNDINQSLIIPLSTAQVLSKYAIINNIVMRLDEGSNINIVSDQINSYITDNLPGKKAFIRSAEQIIESMVAQRKIYTILLGLIGGISLLVGGIGVMNIMLVSVIERRREIGIRKAVGATRQDIRLLFLIESVTLSLFGGVLGVILGVLTSYIIARLAHWKFVIFLVPPLVGFLVSVATGIFFGFYPALKAAQLDPIQALRTE